MDALTPAAPEAPQPGSPRPPRRGVVRRLGDRVGRLAAMPVEGWVTLVVVVGCSAFVFGQLHPALLLDASTPAGGDMGAHVWGPAYLRDHLLTEGRWSGWSPDWYAGFPAYHFYMVTPSILIALVSYLVPYGVAFKLVTVSGVVTMPISAWAFGRLSGLRFPGPALAAVAATIFLFDRSFSIYGGNIPSTLAGEFAFSMSLSIALVYLGVVVRGMRTGRCRGWAALLLALCGLTHIIPAFFALGVTFVIWLVFAAKERELWVPLAAVALAAGGAWSVAGGGWGLDLEIPTVGRGMIGVASAITAYLIWAGRHLLRWFLLVLPVAGLLSAFWVVPFFVQRGYLNDMGWEKKVGLDIPNYLFTRETLDHQLVDSPPITLVLVLAAAAAVVGLLARNRIAVVLTASAALAALAFWLVPEGRLWNARLLPFYYLSLLLLVAVGTAEVVRALAALFPTDRARDPARPALGARHGLRGSTLALVAASAALAFVVLAGFGSVASDLPEQTGLARVVALAVAGFVVGVVLVLRWVLTGDDAVVGWQRIVRVVACGGLALWGLGFLAWTTHTLPFGRVGNDGSYEWLWAQNDEAASFVRGWAEWNYTGYEGKDAWPEYRDIVATMAQVGEEQGCGRAMWEHEEQHNRYGTPMALMLLPFWTDGCIGSMEGLYFEASSTTPYHFLNQDELSTGPSNAQRDLPYVAGAPTPEQFDLGVSHLQMMGVRYYMAITGRMQSLAEANPDLELVATSGPWKVYEVAGSELVESLTAEPAVVTGVAPVGHMWLDLSTRWYLDPDAWQVPLADGGPESWQRIECSYDKSKERDTPRTLYGERGECETPEVRAVDPVEVSGIVEGTDSIEFDVDRTGVPVVVKASYFPNWTAEGAEGPWRLTPNLMVVVPTSEHVELHYGRTTVDLAAMAASLVGLVWLVYLFRAGPLALGRTEEEAAAAADPADPFATPIVVPAGVTPAFVGPAADPGPGPAPGPSEIGAPPDGRGGGHVDGRGGGHDPAEPEVPGPVSRVPASDLDPALLILGPDASPPAGAGGHDPTSGDEEPHER